MGPAVTLFLHCPISPLPHSPITTFPHYHIPPLPHSDIYTRLRLGGRHPLCGIGVTSRIDFTSRPTVCRARIADSRPEPGPFTRTSSERMPTAFAALPAF